MFKSLNVLLDLHFENIQDAVEEHGCRHYVERHSSIDLDPLGHLRCTQSDYVFRILSYISFLCHFLKPCKRQEYLKGGERIIGIGNI